GEEGIKSDKAALQMIARAADGSLRDSLSLLDQAIAYCAGALEEAPVADMLGTIDRNHVFRILRLLADDDSPGIIAAIAEIDEQFPDYGRLLDDLARVLQRVAIFQAIGAVDSEDDFDAGELQPIAQRLSPADVQLFYQTAIIGRRDLFLAPDPRSGAEMTLLRMLAFRPAQAAEEPGGGSVPKPRPRAAEPRARAASAAPAIELRPAAWKDPDWGQLLPALNLKGAVRLLAINCAFVERRENTLHFELDSKSESMLTAKRKAALAEALSSHFGETLLVSIDVASDSGTETPQQQENRAVDERYAAARASLEADPNVKTLQTMFGAELKTDSIKPVDKGSTQ
ncbi:MAG: DNA polymerase III subunit gamma/tau C-terminal domain-containing protein, partial [Woeseiaceae bacterium]|nr:DNA polymerase III subunit gamma/tau C-terminal domain-containing protein [Woeseiaceae bacterium]